MASAAAGGPLLADEEDGIEDTLGKAEADAAEDARQTGQKLTVPQVLSLLPSGHARLPKKAVLWRAWR